MGFNFRVKQAPFTTALSLILFLGLSCSSLLGAERWVPKGPWGGRVSAIALHPTDPSILYAGTYTGVYRSSDRGQTWVGSGRLLDVLTIVIDPVNPSTLYAGTKRDGVYRSTDAGASWTEINTGLTNNYVRVLTLDPSSTSTVYAGTALAGVFRSTDGGDTWVSLHPDVADLNVREIAIQPDDPSVVYIASSGGVHRSDDGGATWVEMNSGLNGAHVMSLAIDPITPSTLYAGTAIDGAYWSTDGGNSWNPLGSGLENLWVTQFAFHSQAPGDVYVGTFSEGVFLKTAQGEAWTPIVSGLTQTDVHTLVIERGASPVFYAGTDDGLFRSEDGGGNWTGSSTGLMGASVWAAAIDPANPSTLYVGTSGGGVYRSTDGSETWTAVNVGLTDLEVSSLAIDPVTPSTLFAGTRDGVYRSVDSGERWARVFGTSFTMLPSALVINPVSPSVVYVGGWPFGVIRSTDGGDNWTQVTSGLPEGSSQVDLLIIDPQTPTILYVGASDGIYRSTDSGDNWAAVGGELANQSIQALAIDPVMTSVLYAATFAGPYRSSDSGVTWTHIDQTLGKKVVTGLYVDPVVPSTIYATTTAGVYRSTNRGERWVSSRSGLISYFTTSMLQAAESDGGLYVGTSYGGLHKAVPYQFELPVAQIGDGGGDLSSQVFMINPSESESAHTQLRPRNDQGTALEIDLNGKEVEEELDLTIPPAGMRVLESDGEGAITVGSLVAYSDQPISGGILVGGGYGVAGFGPSPRLPNGFIAPVEANSAEQVLTGIALVNLDESEMEVNLSLCDAANNTLSTSSVVLAPGGHLARFVTEFDWDQQVDLSSFTGLLKASAGSGLTATVIQTRPGEYATMPVVARPGTGNPKSGILLPNAAENGSFELYFAQFGDGSGALFSQVMLINLDDAQEAEATLFLRTDEGNPLSVDLNGVWVEGETTVTVPAGGLQLLQTDGLGALTAGSVTVESNRPLAGVILFGGSGGVAGVGAGEILPDGFLAPIVCDASRQIRTGVAIMGLEDTEVPLHLTLTDMDGIAVATSQVTLPARGHLARFADQFEWSEPVDFSKFQGILRAETEGKISATVIQTRPDQLATIPIVTPGQPD